MPQTCHHCGKDTSQNLVIFNRLPFCCSGCKTVYCLIHENELGNFYSLYPKKGNKPHKKQNYPFLEDKSFRKKWETFREGEKVQITLNIPSIHCSACIWVLEHLPQIEKGIQSAEVNFTKRKLILFYDEKKIKLQSICYLLNQLGYPPDFSLSSQKKVESQKKKRALWLKIGIAGFAFGNTMFLSIATYFETDDPWLMDLRPWFDFIMFAMSLPVVFYAANDYFTHALKSLLNKMWSLDLPIALGVSVLFLKSIHNAFFLQTLPYFDSLTGLVFFLLLGKYMQRKVYDSFSFERDYKSFFPLAVSVLTQENTEKTIHVSEIKKGNQMVLKPDEIIPVDAKAISTSVILDYSFVTGESRDVELKKGAEIFAGGRVKKKAIIVEAQKTLDQSYLIQLWNKNKNGEKSLEKSHSLADRFSRFFTPTIISISLFSGVIWGFIDPSRVVEIMAAILIVACPCALALSEPFVLGNMLRYFGRIGFYLKNTDAILRIAATDHWVFDKTGTLTQIGNDKVSFFGNKALEDIEKKALRSIVYQSSHPLSKAIFNHLDKYEWSREIQIKQFPGYGIETEIEGHRYRLGSSDFIKRVVSEGQNSSCVFVEIDGVYRGGFSIKQNFRRNIELLLRKVGNRAISILSGDSPHEQDYLEKITPPQTTLLFEQNPFEKIHYIQKLNKTKKVLMFGDGLNDAGALKRSHAGIAISNQNHMFTPACDAILLGEKLPKFNLIFDTLKESIRWVRISLIFSLLYNLIGISIAIMGYLNPIVAAILMPSSSITVVLLASLSTALLNQKLLIKLKT